MSWKGFKLMLLLVGILAVSAQAENSIINGDFSDGLTGWTTTIPEEKEPNVPGPIGTIAVVGEVAVMDNLGTAVWPTSSDLVLEQYNVPVSGGDNLSNLLSLSYKILETPEGGWAEGEGWSGGGVGVNYWGVDEYDDPLWLDWGWENFDYSSDDWVTDFSPTYQSGDLEAAWTAPAGTTNMILAFKVWGGEGGYATAYIDDVVLIPEPATIAMLGLGGLALIRRKRA